MSEEALSPAHLWVRASEYVIAGGRISADPQSNFEAYDPYEADRQAGSEEERPYKALLRLVQRINLDRRGLGKREQDELSRWLAQNGLLGMLPHETLAFSTWPRWEAPPPELRPGEGPPLYGAYQRCVRRAAAGWRTHMQLVGPELPEGSVEPGAEVPAELLSEELRPIEATYRRWPNGELESKPLSSWSTYFPDLSPHQLERAEHASFWGESFWMHYSEPLSIFLAPMKRLALLLAIFERGRPSEGKRVRRSAAAALAQINDAAFGSHLAAYLDLEGKIAIGWAAPSLFGAFATLLLKDLAAGQQVLRCPICGGVFLSAAYQARFCSTACRFAHHKREQRKRKADEEKP